MSRSFVELWKILDDLHDYVGYGYRRSHPEPPPMRSEQSDSGSEGLGERNAALERIATEVAGCRRCRLHEGRRNTVPGMGVANPLVLVIGEGPGAEEDARGLPFVGPAGRYLDKWLAAVGLARQETCFIANIVKCRPPSNRDPAPDEADACIGYLDRQIEILSPKAILTVGRVASSRLIGSTEGIGRLRGSVYAYRGIPLVPTYHPSGVLRNPEFRQAVWDDLKILKRILEPR
jgi:uracil-DNA glycosylase